MFADDAYKLEMNIYVNNIKYARDDIRNKDTKINILRRICFFFLMRDGFSLAPHGPFHVLEMCFQPYPDFR